jgi:hypothetical protein
VAGDDTVARDDLVGHPEVPAAVRDELVELFERSGIEKQIHPLAGRELSRRMLALDAVGATAQLGAAFEVGELVYGLQAFTACAFSQSFKNFSRPMLVSGWLNS